MTETSEHFVEWLLASSTLPECAETRSGGDHKPGSGLQTSAEKSALLGEEGT